MADKNKKTTASKKETKSKTDSLSKSTPETKNTDNPENPTSESTPATKNTDNPGNATSESKGYTIGERQKPVTDTYRASWDRIFRKR